MSYQGLLYLPHSVCTLLLLHANNKGADQHAQLRSQLALESVMAYTTFTNFSMKYLVMCKVCTDIGGIK